MTRTPPRQRRALERVGAGMAILLCAMLVADCQRQDAPRSAAGGIPPVNMAMARAGQKLFRSRSFGRLPVSCADCHAETDDSLAAGERLRPGHSILGASRRLSTWNGAVTGADLEPTAAGAARCALRFMGRRANESGANESGANESSANESSALSAEEASALMDFFEAISTGDEARTLAWTAIAGVADTAHVRVLLDSEARGLERMRGDAQRGAMLYARACAACHPADRGDAARGLRSLQSHTGRLPRILRLGSGAMPFFATDKLSPQDIADVIEYIARAGR